MVPREDTAATFKRYYSGVINEPARQILLDAGFMAIRPVVAYPDINQRSCMFQGIVCPTMFNLGDRLENAPFSQLSWFCRPQSNNTINDEWSRNYGTYDYDWSSSKPLGYNTSVQNDLHSQYLTIGNTGNNDRNYFVSPYYNLASDYFGEHTNWTAGDVDYAEYRHWASLKPSNSSNAEIQNATYFYPWDNDNFQENNIASLLNLSEGQSS